MGKGLLGKVGGSSGGGDEGGSGGIGDLLKKAVPQIPAQASGQAGPSAGAMAIDTRLAEMRERALDEKLNKISSDLNKASVVRMSLFGDEVPKVSVRREFYRQAGPIFARMGRRHGPRFRRGLVENLAKANVGKAVKRAFTLSSKAKKKIAEDKARAEVRREIEKEKFKRSFIARAFTVPKATREKIAKAKATAKARKSQIKADQMKVKKADIKKVYAFETERALLKKNIANAKQNIKTLKKRNKKVPYPDARKSINYKIQDAELKLNRLETKVKGLSATSFSAEPFIVLDPGQGLTVLKTYNSEVIGIDKDMKGINDVIAGTPPAVMLRSGQVVPKEMVTPSGSVEMPGTAGTPGAGKAMSKASKFIIPLIVGGAVILLISKKRR
jgi:hypothetical protein